MLELITGVVVAALAVAAVLEPLMRPSAPGPLTGPPSDDLDLEEEDSPKTRALLALREIEFDRATGKLSENDYADLKRRYGQEALAAIEAERAAGEGAPASGAVPPPLDPIDDPAEAAIARVRAQRATTCPTCHHQLEAGSVFCAQCGRSLLADEAAPRCWVCGADLEPDAKFCGGCGTSTPAPAPGGASR